MKNQRTYIVCLVVIGTLYATSTKAEESGVAEIELLKELLIEQQIKIQKLEENQIRQAKEIDHLKRQFNLDNTMSKTDPPAGNLKSEDHEFLAENKDKSNLSAVSTSPTGFNVTIGGHINRAINIVDDGESTDTYFVDSGNYPTLMYLKGSKSLGNGLKFGGHIEYALQSNSANAVSQDNPNPGLSTTARYFELTLDSTRYGKTSFGRGFMSSFLVAELDQSETWRYNLLSVGNSFGGIKFVDSLDGSLTDIQVSSVFVDVETFSLRDRIRYDSPSWGGFQISGSAGTGDSGDITFRWRNQLSDWKLFAGGSWQSNSKTGRIDERIDAGMSAFHIPTGLNLAVGGARQEYVPEFFQRFNRNEGDNHGYTIRAGVRQRWFSPGETRFALDYSRINDALYKDDQGESYGLFMSQMIDTWGAEFYAGYRLYKYNTGPNSEGLVLDDVRGITVGARVGFNTMLSDY